MLTTDYISDYFLKVRNLKRQSAQSSKSSESEKIITKTNKLNETLKTSNPAQKYKNNLSDDDFNFILKNNMMYELDDYKTNYSYDQPNNLDPEFNFNTDLQDTIIDFFNNNFYNKNNMYKFMRLINETFELALGLFVKHFKLDDDDIRLVFYNDIVLRKLAEKLLYTLPNKSSINLSGYFEKYFNSDTLDWYIILHPELENYNNIHSKLKFYIALIMKQINLYIDLNRREIIDYFKYNDGYKQYIKLKLSSVIEAALNNLDGHKRDRSNFEVEEAHILSNVHTYRHNDKTVLLNNNAKNHLFQINIVEKEDKITYKQCLSFSVLLKNTYFNRNKEHREIKQSISIPIPIFSVTFGNKKDSFVQKLIASNENVREYSYIFSIEDIFVFEGLSFKFICDVLESLAYDEEPWKLINWKHTYGRLMFFYLIDLFVNVRSHAFRNSIITLSVKYINLLKYTNKEFSKGDEKELNIVYEMLLRKYKKNLNIKLIKLIEKIHKYNITYKHNIMFKEFIEFIYNILVVIENIFRNIYKYCTQSNEVLDETLYKGDIQYLI
jgi:hypothetical protein